MAKRPSLKARGADIFLGEEAGVKAGQEYWYTSRPASRKSDFLPAGGPFNTFGADLWMSLRKSNRKLKKSHLVSELLEKGIREMETELSDLH